MESEIKDAKRIEASGINGEDEQYFVVGRSIKTKVLDKINSGSYGQIHNGIFMNTNEKVAVKLELMKSPHPQLLSEGNIMRHLEKGPGVPKIFWFGSFEPSYNVMVMDMLGPNLQEFLAYCGHKFSLKTVLLLADQMLETLDFVHSKEYVHRDIKPDNFATGMIGSPSENRIYLLDFGLAKKIQKQRFSLTSFSAGYSVTQPTVGTVRYMGLHAHDGQGDQPRDDLESLAYVFVYFLKGRLPWQGVKGCRNREEKLKQIRKIKGSISPEELCSDLPRVFAEMIERCRRAKLHDGNASAKSWRRAFQSLASEMGIEYDLHFDWVVKKEQTGEDIVMTKDVKNHGHNSS